MVVPQVQRCGFTNFKYKYINKCWGLVTKYCNETFEHIASCWIHWLKYIELIFFSKRYWYRVKYDVFIWMLMLMPMPMLRCLCRKFKMTYIEAKVELSRWYTVKLMLSSLLHQVNLMIIYIERTGCDLQTKWLCVRCSNLYTAKFDTFLFNQISLIKFLK